MSAANQPGPVLSFVEARLVVEEQARTLHPPGVETVLLLDAAGRVLATDVVADRDFPPFARATRDGFALRAADLEHVPARLKIVAEIRAGVHSDCTIRVGECAEIMTGAPVPAGADAVVMVEHTSRSGDSADIQRRAMPGENIVAAGSEARAGAALVARGTRIGYPQVAVAAAVGDSRVDVYRRARVAVLSTGDELVPVDGLPGADQIRNSNSYSVAAQVAAAGAQPILLPIAPDELARLRELVEEGLRFDLLLLTGGVSMGKYDLVEQVLGDLRAEFLFTGAQIQPGRPVVFGRAPASAEGRTATYFFGLPGNPISTMVTFELFVRPLLDALGGAPVSPLLFLQAKLKSEFRTKTGLTRFLPAMLTGRYAETTVEPVRWQGSGDIASNARANCYVVIPPDRERISPGELVSVLLR